MKKTTLVILSLAALVSCTQRVQMDKDVLMDKVKGAWAGKLIGCTYGLPTEFRYQGDMIPDTLVIPWDGHDIYRDWLVNKGNDDVYMNLTFVDVFERLGLDAPADSFAVAFARGDYGLWHANQMGRYNVLHGMMPPLSGFWKNNPHADDIDFQIESDFAGIMCPGMPRTAAEYCDRVGHIMNYGDGWYGGVYVAEMLSLAFTSNDVDWIVREALKSIPDNTRYHECIADVISWYDANPDDWTSAWRKATDKYSDNYGCPGGMGVRFNIDAVLNSAYVVIGLLYGEGDFFRTCDIATRCGHDSDCNPATALGVLGTVLGYSNIPEKWLCSVKEIEDLEYAKTGRSINDIYNLSYSHALRVIAKEGGKVGETTVEIKTQDVAPVRYEKAFEGVRPGKRVDLDTNLAEPVEFGFEGRGILISGGHYVYDDTGRYADPRVEVRIDGQVAGVVDLPVCFLYRKDFLFADYDLGEGHHDVTLTLLNPECGINVEVWFYYPYETEE